MFQVGQRVAEARAFDCYSQTHPNPVLVLGNAWLERMVHPVTPADQIWHCPLHPARDFYNPNAFLIAAAQQNMVPVNSSAQLSVLPLGSRLFIHYNKLVLVLYCIIYIYMLERCFRYVVLSSLYLRSRSGGEGVLL